MKKLILLGLAIFSVGMLSACSDAVNQKDVLAADLSSEESLATLSYLSAGFLETSNTTASSNVMFLSNEETTEIEDELDEVNVYMDRLKGFIDNGVESFGAVTEEVSDNELYTFMITFTVSEEIYKIYYNIDVETEEVTGVILIGEVEYEFEVVDNIKTYEFHNEEHKKKGTDDDEEETDQTEELDEPEENESKMVLIAHNGDNTIKVIYKTETEEDETTTKFFLEQTIDGVKEEVRLKISQEENEYKVDVEEGENTYTFKREVEEEGTVYKLQYRVDGVSGFVKIIETFNEDGEVEYEYQIHENDINKNVKKGKPESPGNKNKNNEEDESTEDSTGL